MPDKQRKTTYWCSTCHKYICLCAGSTCFSDYYTKYSFGIEPRVAQSNHFWHVSNCHRLHHSECRGRQWALTWPAEKIRLDLLLSLLLLAVLLFIYINKFYEFLSILVLFCTLQGLQLANTF